ncbi:MAG TPA: PLP-dependent aspartate aminotransferase family protein [Thermoanaerobaculia bacterium]|nr:PLP-dependent aspartate aminotransferase family protein [Thermoanaerobaculia bacterium]
MKGDPEGRAFATRAIHAGQPPDPTTGSVTVPIYQTSTYEYVEAGRHTGYEYARVQNPTRRALERNLSSLEEGLDGHAFASGMAAITSVMTLVPADCHVVASRTVYGGTYRLFEQVLDRYRLRVSWVDTTDLDAVAAAIVPETRLVFLESPTNPLMEITDIAAVAEIAHRAGALVCVDNTFLSPYLQRPLALGADLVVHSTTKFLNGHSDSIGGVVVTSREEDARWFAFLQKSVGAILSPFDSFLTLRGTKTLAVRMERHEANARALAAVLDHHPKVRRVYYPGLPGHPGHAIHRRQASGFGAMIAFDLGTLEAAMTLLNSFEVFTLAESLGGVESLVSHPATMTHAAIPEDELRALGVGPGLVRLSVGIEDAADLLADLEQALASASGAC